MKIAVHGLGRMGMQLARKLAESGEHEVFGLNRSQAPMDEAATYGVKPSPVAKDIPGEFGIRLEDDMAITENGAELFTPQSPSLERPFALS